MIRRKKKGAAAQASIRISNAGQTYYAGPICELPVAERVLIAKSIEFYADPEPCFIHRSAVQARLYAELSQWLEEAYGAMDEYSTELSEIPLHIINYFFNHDV